MEFLFDNESGVRANPSVDRTQKRLLYQLVMTYEYEYEPLTEQNRIARR
jgi:hypothetical protein